METIYLNHAGTSWPKPPEVVAASESVLHANPGDWPKLFSNAHEAVAKFYHLDSKRLLLTPSCTAALQLAVLDHAWQPGDRVLTSHFEHHALQRALVQLETRGVTVTVLPYGDDEPMLLEALEAELKLGSVRMLALTAACNVTGRLLPVAEATAMAHRYDAMTLVDGAQIAGWWDLDVNAWQADLFTFAGHKGPQAPWGVGGLYVHPGIAMACPTAVCEIGERSRSLAPALMPGYCDAGSVNLAALVGLAAGCEWLESPTRRDRLQTARGLAAEFTAAVRQLPRVTIHHDAPADAKMPTVALSVAERHSEEIARELGAQGVIVSAGFQCAPQAHRALGTSASGVVRFSFGPTNQAADVPAVSEMLGRLLS